MLNDIFFRPKCFPVEIVFVIFSSLTPKWKNKNYYTINSTPRPCRGQVGLENGLVGKDIFLLRMQLLFTNIVSHKKANKRRRCRVFFLKSKLVTLKWVNDVIRYCVWSKIWTYNSFFWNIQLSEDLLHVQKHITHHKSDIILSPQMFLFSFCTFSFSMNS